MMGKAEGAEVVDPGSIRYVPLGKLLCFSDPQFLHLLDRNNTSYITYVTVVWGELINRYFWKPIVKCTKNVYLLIHLNSCRRSVPKPYFLIFGVLSSNLYFPLEPPQSLHECCWPTVGWIGGLHITALGTQHWAAGIPSPPPLPDP